MKNRFSEPPGLEKGVTKMRSGLRGLHGKQSDLRVGLVVSGLFALTLTLGGCGSGGGQAPSTLPGEADVIPVVQTTSTPISNRGTGQARFFFAWPGAQQAASSSPEIKRVRFQFVKDGEPIAGTERILTRPEQNGEQTDTVAWNALPVGDLTARVSAYTDQILGETPQAQTAIVVTIADGQVPSATFTIQSQVDHLQITTGALVPATKNNPATVFKSDELPLAVAAVDKSNRVVLVDMATATAGYTWTSSDETNVPLDVRGGTATLLAKNPTISTIKVADLSSGKNASRTIPVTAFVATPVDSLGGVNGGINKDGWILMRGYVKKPPYTRIFEIASREQLGAQDLSIAGLNNKNQIAGRIGAYDASYSEYVPFIWQEGTGLVRVPATSGEKAYAVLGLSDTGQLLVEYVATENNQTKNGYGFLDPTNGKVTRLQTDIQRDGRTGYTDFYRCTPAGQAIFQLAFYGAATNGSVGLVFAPGTAQMQYVLPLSGDALSTARSGNALGVIVGSSSGKSAVTGASDFESHAIFWTSTSGTSALPTSKNWPSTSAEGINGQGYVVGSGYQRSVGARTALLWRNDRPRQLDKMLMDGQNLTLLEGRDIGDSNYVLAYTETGDAKGTVILIPVTGKAKP